MPNIGRYLEADLAGISGGANIYLYAAANPTQFTDHVGRQYEPFSVPENSLTPETPEQIFQRQVNQRYDTAGSAADGLQLIDEFLGKAQGEIDEGAANSYVLNTDFLPPAIRQQFEDAMRLKASGPMCTTKNPLGQTQISNQPPTKYAVEYWTDDDNYVHLSIVSAQQLQQLQLSGHLLSH